jgi:hypothetical protein
VNQRPPAAGEDFSLARGGPFYSLLHALRLAKPPLGLGISAAVLLCVLTWLPLLALSVVQGTAFGAGIGMPFLHDFPVTIRFLLAIPLMFVAERVVDRRVNGALRLLAGSGLVADRTLPALESLLGSAQRLINSGLAELAGVAVVIIGVVYLRLEMTVSVAGWQFLPNSAGATRTLAGWWYILVSLPIFQFLLYRWIWRYLVWSWMLWRISRLDLQLIPTHPDRAAGLSILGLAQAGFGVVAFAISSVISAEYAQEFLLGATTISQSELAIFGYVVLMLVALLGPLLVFSDVLVRVQLKGLRDYGALANRYTLEFDRKWIKGEAPAEEPLLGSADIQSLADLANSYGIIGQIRYAPMDPLTVLLPIFACIVVPLLPAALTAVPVDQIVRGIMTRLL